MKDTYYFSHDYNARNDHKIKKLISKHGYLGYGLFWAIIEDLYNNANALQTDYESIAFDLRTSENIIESIINDFDLFVINADSFGSISVQRRLEERDAKSLKARESAFKRWNKENNNANALQSDSDSNAIKESKGKENKKENIKIDNSIEFKNEILSYQDKYSKDMLEKFYLHWSEKNSKGKMKYELEKTWETEKRLIKWHSNSMKWSTKSNIIDPKKLEADKYIEGRKEAIARGMYEQKDLDLWIKNNYKW